MRYAPCGFCDSCASAINVFVFPPVSVLSSLKMWLCASSDVVRLLVFRASLGDNREVSAFEFSDFSASSLVGLSVVGGFAAGAEMVRSAPCGHRR